MPRTRLTDRIAKTASITERLDKIATELEQVDPKMALAIDLVSDKLENRVADDITLLKKDIEKIKGVYFYNPWPRILKKFKKEDLDRLKVKIIPKETGFFDTDNLPPEFDSLQGAILEIYGHRSIIPIRLNVFYDLTGPGSGSVNSPLGNKMTEKEVIQELQEHIKNFHPEEKKESPEEEKDWWK